MFAIKLIFMSLILFEWNKFCQLPFLVRSESKLKSCGERSSKWSPDKNIFEWPWIASIGHFDNKENQILPMWRHKCGATILNNNTLLTATFCIDDLPDNNQIIVGKYDLNDTFTKYPSLNISNCSISMEHFSTLILIMSLYMNIAIIKTNEVINFTDAVQPICLPYKPSVNENLRENHAVDIVGWSWEEEKIEEFKNLSKKRNISEYEEDYVYPDYDYYEASGWLYDYHEETENILVHNLQHICLIAFVKEKCNQNIDDVGIKIPEIIKTTLTCAETDVRFFPHL